MQDFTLPANIKQIGSIGDGLRIYMEDYVCTFLQQYAESAGFEERLAFLVGRQMVIDGQQFLFIAGAIYGKHVEKYEGHLRFTEKSVNYTEDMMEEYFPGMEILGWMQSQPSYGTYLNQHYAVYHLRQFRKAYQVMFVMDPLERTNAFYAVNPVALTPAERLAEISGYFIYYEKNTNMHEYMLTNKSIDYTGKTPSLVEVKPIDFTSSGPRDSHSSYEDSGFTIPGAGSRGATKAASKGTSRRNPEEDMHEPRFSHDRKPPGASDRNLTGRKETMVYGYDEDEDDVRDGYGRTLTDIRDVEPEETIRRHQADKTRRRTTAPEQKRTVNLLAGLCAVLFVVCFVLGVGLIRNQDEIERMETELRQMSTALRNHFAAQAAETTGGLAPVFAEDDPVIGTDTMGTGVNDHVATTRPDNADPPPGPPTTTIYAPQEETALIQEIPETYTIQPGDSLIAISLRFFQNEYMVEEIMALNGIDDPDHIVAGRTISLPRR